MGILWLIIKIILFVLLALLGFILLGLFIILVSPIRYEVYLEKYSELIYDIKFTYLGMLKGHFCLEDGYKNHEIRMLGKVLYEDRVKEEVVKQKTSEEASVKEGAKQGKKKSKERQQGVETKQARVNESGAHCKEDNRGKYEKKKDAVKKIDTPVAEGAEEVVESAVHKTEEETQRFVSDLDKHQIKELILTKDFLRLIKEILRLIRDILKYILPRKWSYELVIGKEDPADTGELIAKLTMLYPLYYKNGIISGDFEKSGIWGGFLAKGKFSILGILRRIVVFALRPVVRKYIKLILRIRKEEQHGK